MPKFLPHYKVGFYVCFLSLTLFRHGCFGQNSNALSSQRVPTAVLEELESMKKRIEQLEAELKNRNAAEPLAGTVTRESNTPLTLATAPEERAAPFAFADFTWLNGNPSQ